MTDDALAPAAPTTIKLRCSPMLMAEAARWIASYNAWVELWNEHEQSSDVPLSPDWPEAHTTYVGCAGIPKSALVFLPKDAKQIGIIRLRKWRAYERGWSFCRRQADVRNLIWAAWAPIGRSHACSS